MADRPKKRQRISYPHTLNDNDTPSGKRTVRSRAEYVAVEKGKLVESVNTLSHEDFAQLYFPESLNGLFLTEYWNDSRGHSSIFTNATGLSPETLNGCFNLVESTSAGDYRNSEVDWSPAKKKKEMQLPDLKYFILKSRFTSEIIGFISFMVTYEDGHEVLYVYEIHLVPDYQGQGEGPRLMGVAEQIARRVGVEKVMLTVFRNNTRAIGMYERLGYAVDKYSPQPKILRGTMKESRYVILSKSMKETDDVEET
jgi:N-alpha-acetyltransferase 40